LRGSSHQIRRKDSAMTRDGRITFSLDTLLLLVLGSANLWFNPVSSALVVTLMALYVLLGWLAPRMPDEISEPQTRDRFAYSTRLLIVVMVVMVAGALPTLEEIVLRHREGGTSHANDGVIQTEAAVDYILNGQNPYTEDYWKTPMADWQRGEQPWTDAPIYHNPYLPFLFIVSIPFYALSQATLGWYDERFLFLIMYIAILLLLPVLVDKQRDKLVLLSAFGLNLLWAFFLSSGRNDVVILLGLLLTTVLLMQNRVSASALILGLTMAVKQTAWFFFPFYFVFLLDGQVDWKSARRVILQISPLFVAFAVVIVPFLFWDLGSFLDDTVLFAMSATQHSFPIKGWGFSTLLLAAGVIPSAESAFPFGIFVALFGIPALIFLLRWQWRENTLQRMWVSFAAFSFVIEYFSRYFNDNYVIFILQALVIAAFLRPLHSHIDVQQQPA
jgi:hypothetical protein